jgi:hypothetical protein
MIHRPGHLASSLFVLSAVLAGACGTEVFDGSPSEYGPMASTCPEGYVRGETTDGVYLRSEPSTSSAEKSLVNAGTRLCLRADEAGKPVPVEGSSYDRYDGTTLVGSDNRWNEVRWQAAQTWYVASHYVRLVTDEPGPGPGQPVGRRAVLYIQALSDGALSSSMAARQDVVVAIDGSAKLALKPMGYTERNKTFLQHVERAALKISAAADSIAIVISGHSTGPSLWGDYGRIEHQDLAALAHKHPDFARKVRQIYLLGCNTGWRPTMDKWRAPFEEAISVAGFAGKGPGGVPAYRYFAESHAVVEGLTDPVASPGAVILQLSQQPQAVYCYWGFMIISGGTSHWDALKNDSLATARSLYQQTRSVYQSGWLEADLPQYADPPADTHSEIVDGAYTPRKHYNSVQSYRNALVQALNGGSSALHAGESWTLVDQLEAEMQQAIRLVFFRVCKKGWLEDGDNTAALDGWLDGASTKDAIRQAFNAAVSSANPQSAPVSGAVSRVAIKQLTRMETIDFVEELESRVPSASLVHRMRAALVELGSDEIKESYIE